MWLHSFNTFVPSFFLIQHLNELKALSLLGWHLNWMLVEHHRIDARVSRWCSVTACLQPHWHSAFWTVLSLWEHRVLVRRQLPKSKARGTHSKCNIHPVYTLPTRVDFNWTRDHTRALQMPELLQAMKESKPSLFFKPLHAWEGSCVWAVCKQSDRFVLL